jgi:hypothetical protein
MGGLCIPVLEGRDLRNDKLGTAASLETKDAIVNFGLCLWVIKMD